MDAISVNALTKYYGRVAALNNVSFSLTSGAFYTLTGANGSGKSTLLAVIAGLLRPDSGTVNIGGYSVYQQQTRKNAADRHRLQGYQGQKLLLYQDLSVMENLLLVANGFGLSSPKQAVSRVLELMALEASAAKLVRECSQGIARRVSLARAIIHQPKVLLLDEPFVALDSDSQSRLLILIRTLVAEGATILAAIHELELVSDMPHGAIHIQAGCLSA